MSPRASAKRDNKSRQRQSFIFPCSGTSANVAGADNHLIKGRAPSRIFLRPKKNWRLLRTQNANLPVNVFIYSFKSPDASLKTQRWS